MYIFSEIDDIPLHLPISVTVFLKPWFTSETLEKGLDIIRNNDLSRLFFFRDIAMALYRQEFTLALGYRKHSILRQGFSLVYEKCSLCRTNQQGKRCEHIAALCISTLMFDEEREFIPIAFSYKESPWQKISSFLYNWFSAEKGRVQIQESSGRAVITKKASEGSFFATLDDVRLNKWELFLFKDDQSPLDDLYKEIQDATMTASEKQLSVANSFSRSFKRDISLWDRLCKLFFVLGGSVPPELTFDSEQGLFQLEYFSKETADEFVLTLSRQRSVEIIRQLPSVKDEFSFFPPMPRGFQVGFTEACDIKVENIIHFTEEKRIYVLADIKDHKFGNAYYFPGRGFFPLKSLRRGAKLTQPLKQGRPITLFDYMEQDSDYIINLSELAEFIKLNSKALAHPDNIVDPEIFNIEIKTIPDKLFFTDFEEDQGWYYLSCDYGLGTSSISITEILDSKKKNRPIRMGESLYQFDSGPLTWFYDLAAEQCGSAPHCKNRIKLSAGQFFSLTATVGNSQNALKRDNSFKHRLEKLLYLDSWEDKNTISKAPPHLRDYQKNGLAWLYTIYDFGLGALLADDMGLGKTHQGLALVDLVVKKKQGSVTLVVCPAAVLLHWRDKIDSFYPQLSYYIYYGKQRDIGFAQESDLILTTYGMVRSDIELLMEVGFELIILDEIQNVKNRKTRTHKAVQSLHAYVKIGLSGTPIENSLNDIHALFDICLPGYLGSIKEFTNNYMNPVTELDSKKQKLLLAERIKPFILRRSRVEVLTELPALIEDNRKCELSEDQIRLYRDTIAEGEPFINKLESSGEDKIDYINILALITRLKQICNHPCLLENNADPAKYKSGKWDLFVELLAECLGNGLKVVVFSQYTGMLDIIEYYLKECAINFAGLRGNMNVAKREKMIAKFSREKNCRVFCASLLAGGTGIDLVAGQVVIHYDRWWNPAREEQATARLHRMGQKNIIHLFRLITAGTMEEKIHKIITKKEQLASSLIQEDEGGIVKRLSKGQLLNLFR